MFRMVREAPIVAQVTYLSKEEGLLFLGKVLVQHGVEGHRLQRALPDLRHLVQLHLQALEEGAQHRSERADVRGVQEHVQDGEALVEGGGIVAFFPYLRK